MTTLYDKLGGEDVISAAVDLFYEKVLNDSRIKYFFDGIDMNKQKSHQRKFLTYAFGGCRTYNGRSMRAAHKRLVREMGLKNEHFDAIVENLTATLKDLNICDELIQAVGVIAESTRSDVLNHN